MSHNDVFNTHACQRRRVLQALAGAALPAGLLSCSSQEQSESLIVGGLPVTCNLTLPVACEARARLNQQSAPQAGAQPFSYTYSKYSGWPEIKESLMAGRIQAAYMLAPLVMDLANKGIPVRSCRSGIAPAR